MRELPSWCTPAALAWLQTILQERFGQLFTLQVKSDDTLAIGRLDDARCITFALDGATFNRADADLPCAYWNGVAEGWNTVLCADLPAPGVSNLHVPLIETTDCGHHVNYDILGLVYWMLTRREEVGRTDLDAHGRFPATSSHAFKYNYLERPIVDEWLYVLKLVIRQVWPHLELKSHKFTIKVSHDVDTPSLYGFKSWYTVGRMMAGDLLKRRDMRAFATAPIVKLGTSSSLHTGDPYNTFDWIMDQSEANNLQSAFYFICGRTDESRDADYEPEHPAIRKLMRRIHARGHEIGLHPSYASYRDPAIIAAEFQRLRQIAQEEGITQAEWGGRMHYLRWEHPATLRAWADAGMNYDSTLGYADRPGFRCGTCFDYPAFDPVACEMLSLRIRPLIAMECTIIDDIYLGLGLSRRARDKFNSLKEICAKVDGCFTLLWHNSCLSKSDLRKMYSSVMQDCG